MRVMILTMLTLCTPLAASEVIEGVVQVSVTNEGQALEGMALKVVCDLNWGAVSAESLQKKMRHPGPLPAVVLTGSAITDAKGSARISYRAELDPERHPRTRNGGALIYARIVGVKETLCAWSEPIQLTGGAQVSAVQLSCRKPGTLRGRLIRFSTQAPLFDVAVTAELPYWLEGVALPQTKSAKDGTFVLAVPGGVEVTLQWDGHVALDANSADPRVLKSVRIVPAGDELDLRDVPLQAGVRMKLSLQPLDGASTFAFAHAQCAYASPPDNLDSSPPWTWHAFTRADPEVTLLPGLCRLTVVAVGYVDHVIKDLKVLPGTLMPIQVVPLIPWRQARIRVEGEPALVAAVRDVGVPYSRALSATKLEHESQSLWQTSLRPDVPLDLRLLGDGISSHWQTVTFAPPEFIGVMRAEPRAQVQLTVTAASGKVRRSGLAFWIRKGSPAETLLLGTGQMQLIDRHRRQGHDGLVQAYLGIDKTEDMPAGIWHLTMRTEEGVDAVFRDIELRAGENVIDLRQKSARVEIIVRSQAGIVAGKNIILQPSRVQAKTDAEGRAVFENLPEGEYLAIRDDVLPEYRDAALLRKACVTVIGSEPQTIEVTLPDRPRNTPPAVTLTLASGSELNLRWIYVCRAAAWRYNDSYSPGVWLKVDGDKLGAAELQDGAHIAEGYAEEDAPKSSARKLLCIANFVVSGSEPIALRPEYRKIKAQVDKESLPADTAQVTAQVWLRHPWVGETYGLNAVSRTNGTGYLRGARVHPDEQGNFELFVCGHTAGHLSIEAKDAKGKALAESEWDLAQPVPAKLVLSSGTAILRVRCKRPDRESGDSRTAITMTLWREGQASPVRIFAPRPRGELGTTLFGLSAGKFTLRIDSLQHLPEEVEVTLEAGKVTETSIQLRPAAVVAVWIPASMSVRRAFYAGGRIELLNTEGNVLESFSTLDPRSSHLVEPATVPYTDRIVVRRDDVARVRLVIDGQAPVEVPLHDNASFHRAWWYWVPQ